MRMPRAPSGPQGTAARAGDGGPHHRVPFSGTNSMETLAASRRQSQ